MNNQLTIREEIEMYGLERVSDIKVLTELSGAKEEVISALFKEWGSLSRVCANIEFSNELTKRQVEKVLMVNELLSRNSNVNSNDVVRITSPRDIIGFVEDIRHKEQECFIVLCLNNKNEVIKRLDLFKGGQSSCIVDPSILFREVLKYVANGMILAHNHPSGDSAPSPEDIELTEKIIDAGKLLKIRVLDHIILGSRGDLSFMEKNLMG